MMKSIVNIAVAEKSDDFHRNFTDFIEKALNGGVNA